MMRQQLLITLEEDGRIQVQGPIQNKLLCYWLMVVAHPVDNGQPI